MTQPPPPPQQYNIKRQLLQSYLRPDLIPTLSSLDVNDFPHGADAANAATELPVSRLAASPVFSVPPQNQRLPHSWGECCAGRIHKRAAGQMT